MYYNEVLFGFYKNFYSHQPQFRDGLSHPKTALLIEKAEENTMTVIDRNR